MSYTLLVDTDSESLSLGPMDGESERLVRSSSRRRNFFQQVGDTWDSCWDQIDTQFRRIFCPCCRPHEPKARTVWFGKAFVPTMSMFPRNAIKNQKYNVFTFVPLVLFEQFRLFLNFYFLIMALSQFVPALVVAEMYTYWLPLGFIMSVTLIREAIDDVRRWRRDMDINGTRYTAVRDGHLRSVRSDELMVGDIVVLEKNQRVPADCVLLHTSDDQGSCFIRTDQLDGETDWKLKLAVRCTHKLGGWQQLLKLEANVYGEKPNIDITRFEGSMTLHDQTTVKEGVSIEHVIWASTVIATGSATCLILYTGADTRSVLNTSKPKAKIGLLDLEVNLLSKMLFLFVFVLSFVLVAVKGFDGPWPVYLIRYVLLFSNVIPLSLRVNLDMSKLWHSFCIGRDQEIPDTTVRSTTIPEQLGRVQILLSDKTGTLTQNLMIFKKLHIGTACFTEDSMDEVREAASRRTTRESAAVTAVALCHNVTPVEENGTIVYQASSPDEVALVGWTETVGISLVKRDLKVIGLKLLDGSLIEYEILEIFPFTSEMKRMGIVVKEMSTGEITFYLKGADTTMTPIVQYSDWLEEECGNMAREGLRTLVVGRKKLTLAQYEEFAARHAEACASIEDRSMRVRRVLESLETDLELLCLTGVEDKLQHDVRPTLENIRYAGIRIWMLTGDKMETAACIAKSSRLMSRTGLHYFKELSDNLDTQRDEAHLEIATLRRKNDLTLVISGRCLSLVTQFYDKELVELMLECPSVVVCRCSPTQKATIVLLLKKYTDKTIAAIGDGGNDVSMIQAADVGVGILGKEGMQAALAADFSISQFSHILRLLLVHGRNSYKSAASLSMFIVHRGLIITGMQIIFCSVFYLAAVMLFPGFLMVGYSTVFTNFPVFSLCLDKDVSSDIAMKYPELYKELPKGRELSLKRFFIWLLISCYQAAVIMYGVLVLFDSDYSHIMSISFSSLIITELVMVAMVIRTWHWAMIASEFISIFAYLICVVIFRDKFDTEFFMEPDFWWKTAVITAVSCIPLYLVKFLRRQINPPTYTKLS